MASVPGVLPPTSIGRHGVAGCSVATVAPARVAPMEIVSAAMVTRVPPMKAVCVKLPPLRRVTTPETEIRVSTFSASVPSRRSTETPVVTLDCGPLTLLVPLPLQPAVMAFAERVIVSPESVKT